MTVGPTNARLKHTLIYCIEEENFLLDLFVVCISLRKCDFSIIFKRKTEKISCIKSKT